MNTECQSSRQDFVIALNVTLKATCLLFFCTFIAAQPPQRPAWARSISSCCLGGLFPPAAVLQGLRWAQELDQREDEDCHGRGLQGSSSKSWRSWSLYIPMLCSLFLSSHSLTSVHLHNRIPPTCRARCRNTRRLKLSCQLIRAALMPCRSLGKSCWMGSITPPLRWLAAWRRSAPSGRNCSRPLSSKVLAAGKLGSTSLLN